MSRSTPRKKSSANSFPRPDAVLLALLLSCAPVAADNDPYFTLIYDYEVAGFCGLVRQDVHDAYVIKRRALEAQMTQSREHITKVRVHAMAEAERAYIDRSLGGHKPWCNSDGVAGVKRILMQR